MIHEPDPVDRIIMEYLSTRRSIHLSAKTIAKGLEQSGHVISIRSVAWHLQHLPVDATMTNRRKYRLQEQSQY